MIVTGWLTMGELEAGRHVATDAVIGHNTCAGGSLTQAALRGIDEPDIALTPRHRIDVTIEPLLRKRVEQVDRIERRPVDRRRITVNELHGVVDAEPHRDPASDFGAPAVAFDTDPTGM